jgi:hypothetical protein
MLYIHKKDEDMTLIELEDPENDLVLEEEINKALLAAKKRANLWNRENRILNSLRAHIVSIHNDKTQKEIDAKIDHLVDFCKRNPMLARKSPVLHALLSFMAVWGDQFPKDANVCKAWQYGKYLYEIHNIKRETRIVFKRDGITLLSFS